MLTTVLVLAARATLLIVPSVVAFPVVSAPAQEPCRVPLSAAPDYGGVRLGMTVADVGGMFPGSRALRESARSPAPRVLNVSLGPLDLNIRKEQFAGVSELTLSFVEGRLRRIGVHFGAGSVWPDVSEFSEHVSRRLALPRDSWGTATTEEGERETRSLTCRGFAVFAEVKRGGPAFVSIFSTQTEAPARAKP